MNASTQLESSTFAAICRARAALARADDPTLSDGERDAAMIEADKEAESFRPVTPAELLAVVAYTIDSERETMDESPLQVLEHVRAGLEAMAA